MTPDIPTLLASLREAHKRIKRVETDYAADGGTTWHEYREAKADFGEKCITRVLPLCDAIEELQGQLAEARNGIRYLMAEESGQSIEDIPQLDVDGVIDAAARLNQPTL